MTHVSPALAHERHWVTASGLVVVACALVQMVVFGFVHFTDVRWTSTRRPGEQANLSVVVPEPDASIGERGGGTDGVEVARPNRVLGRLDVVLGRASGIASTAGIAGSILLVLTCLMGVAIAGGASVPGVERAVTAANWAIVLAIGCLPWQRLLPEIPFPGVFSDYAGLVEASESVLAGDNAWGPLVARFAALPLLAAIMAVLVIVRFRAGIARGVIVEHLSEIDERLEREIQNIRKSGFRSGRSRATGAFDRTIPRPVEAPAIPTGSTLPGPVIGGSIGPEPDAIQAGRRPI